MSKRLGEFGALSGETQTPSKIKKVEEVEKIGLGNVGDWHRNWQLLFPRPWLEYKFDKISRRTDVNIPESDLVVEFQHSPINNQEIVSRNDCYKQVNKIVIWILDGATCGAEYLNRKVNEYEWLISVQNPKFIKNFDGANYVLIDIDSDVFLLRPESFRNGTQRVCAKWTKEQIVEILKNTERHHEILKAPHPTVQSEIKVWQYPPGSGKSYRLIEGILTCGSGFSQYDVFLIFTKPHSAKEVIRSEMDDQLRKREIQIIDQGAHNKAYFYSLMINGRERLVMMATIDSFIYQLGEPHNAIMDRFEGICRTIAEKGPKTHGTRGSVFFKNKTINLNGKCLIAIDEATKLSLAYLPALSKMTFVCNADALIIGDKMQSIESENNLLTSLLDYNDTTGIDHMRMNVVPPGTEIRRFGPKLTEFLNNIIPWQTHGLPVPTSANCERESEGIIEVDVMDMNYTNILENEQKKRKNVEELMNKIKKDIDSLLLLPHHMLFVSPIVLQNDFLDELRDELHEHWKKKLTYDNEYRKKLVSTNSDNTNMSNQQYLDWYDNRNDNHLLAIRHYSEGQQPVDTSKSDKRTRMVSIHASQGDGRRYCVTIGLTEQDLCKFTKRKINLQYESLLCVALSRAKTKLVVILNKKYDDVYRRMYKYVPTEMRVEPVFFTNKRIRLSPDDLEFDITLSERINSIVLPTLIGDAKQKPLLDNIHHLIRYSTYFTVFVLRAIERVGTKMENTSQFVAKISEICSPAVYVEECDIKNYYQKLREKPKNGPDGKCHLQQIPLLKYSKSPYNCDILKATQAARSFLRQWLCGQASWETLRENILIPVMIHYMFDFENNGHNLMTKMSSIHEIAESVHTQKDLSSFYSSINDAIACFDRIHHTLPDGRWLMNHMVTLGKSNGYELPDFSGWIKIDFIVYTQSVIYAINIKSQVNELNAPHIANEAFITKRLISQPKTETNKNERLKDKEIHTLFIDTSTGKKHDVPHDYIDNLEIDKLVAQIIKCKCEEQHQNIKYFFDYHGGSEIAHESFIAYKNVLEKNNKLMPDYIERAFEDHCDDTKTFLCSLDHYLRKSIKTYLMHLKIQANTKS